MLSYQAVVKQISAGKYSPLYLLFGEEYYLQEELIGRLAEGFLGRGEDFGLEIADGRVVDLPEALETFEENSIFSRRRLLVLRNPSFLNPPRKTKKEEEPPDKQKLAQADENRLQAVERYLQQAEANPGESMLVITAGKVDRRKRLYRTIDKKAVTVELALLKGGLLRRWVTDKAKRLGMSISPEALSRLLMAGDKELYYYATELEKYQTFMGEKKGEIDLSLVEQLFSGDLEGNVFKLADALAEKKLSEADRLLAMLLGRRENAVQIFFMLTRHYRLLLKTRLLLDEGLPPSEFPALLGVLPFVAPRLREQAVFFNQKTLEDVIIILQDADGKIKTGQIDPRHALDLVMKKIDHLQHTAL